MSTTLSEIWPSIGPFFHSFDHNSLEALIMFFRMVQERSVRFSLRSGQRSGQTLVKLGRIRSKPSKLWEMCLGPHFEGFWAWWTLVELQTARSNLGQTLVNPGQTWSTLVKLGQTSPNSGKRILGRISRVFGHSGPHRVRNDLVNPWSNLVNPSQTWSNFGKYVPDLLLGVI